MRMRPAQRYEHGAPMLNGWIRNRWIPILSALWVISSAACGAGPSGAAPESGESGAQEVQGTGYAPAATPATLGLAGYAKVLCSAVFVSGRDSAEAFRNSGFFLMDPADRDDIAGYEVDRDERSVTMQLTDGTTRKAGFYGDQGCVVHPVGYDGVFFQPLEVESSLPPANAMPWPMGDVISDEPLAACIDEPILEDAVEAAFSDAEALTAAFLVAHEGRIIGERYDLGVGSETQLESWSMGKSLTATLVGRLIQEGHFDLYDPAPIPEWHVEKDPRSAIRISDLLRMSSGLEFTGTNSPEVLSGEVYPDHMLVYTGAIDVFDFSASRPLEFAPNTVGRYRNSDPLALGRIIEQTVVEDTQQPYFTYPQRELFDRIGIREQVLEPDPYGNFVLTGYDYGTARNWARIGMLYLNDGVWQGERLLPEGFVEFVSTPAPAWEEPVYGGLFWLNRTGEWNLPEDAFFAAGGGGQRTFIVPSRNMVIVRMGHFRGAERETSDGSERESLNQALALLMEAVPQDCGTTSP